MGKKYASQAARDIFQIQKWKTKSISPRLPSGKGKLFLKKHFDQKAVMDVKQMVDKLHEFNPMLGHRGCRLGVTYPEITEMQARAIIEAACQLKSEGVNFLPEIPRVTKEKN